MFGMTTLDRLLAGKNTMRSTCIGAKVWIDNLGWVGIDPNNGFVWTKGLWLVKGLRVGGSSYNGFVLAIKFNM
eukprot:352541-Amphidinium_carterae.1